MNHDLEELIRELASWAEDDALGLVVALLDTRSPRPTCRAMVKSMLIKSRLAPSRQAISDARKRSKKRLALVASKCVIREEDGQGN